MIETAWYAHRPLWQLLMSGVFERFPNLKLVLTEQGCDWIPPLLMQLDAFHMQMQSGRIGEMNLDERQRPAADADRVLRAQRVGRRELPRGSGGEGLARLGLHKVMWGSDYPHNEGTSPYSRESLRRTFHDWTPEDLRQVLSGTAADLYGFDLEALGRDCRERCRSDGRGGRHAARADPEGRVQPRLLPLRGRPSGTAIAPSRDAFPGGGWV